MPLLGIANTLNGEGVKGKTGGRFYASTIKAILGNTVIPSSGEAAFTAAT